MTQIMLRVQALAVAALMAHGCASTRSTNGALRSVQGASQASFGLFELEVGPEVSAATCSYYGFDNEQNLGKRVGFFEAELTAGSDDTTTGFNREEIQLAARYAATVTAPELRHIGELTAPAAGQLFGEWKPGLDDDAKAGVLQAIAALRWTGSAERNQSLRVTGSGGADSPLPQGNSSGPGVPDTRVLEEQIETLNAITARNAEDSSNHFLETVGGTAVQLSTTGSRNQNNRAAQAIPPQPPSQVPKTPQSTPPIGEASDDQVPSQSAMPQPQISPGASSKVEAGHTFPDPPAAQVPVPRVGQNSVVNPLKFVKGRSAGRPKIGSRVKLFGLVVGTAAVAVLGLSRFGGLGGGGGWKTTTGDDGQEVEVVEPGSGEVELLDEVVGGPEEDPDPNPDETDGEDGTPSTEMWEDLQQLNFVGSSGNSKAQLITNYRLAWASARAFVTDFREAALKLRTACVIQDFLSSKGGRLPEGEAFSSESGITPWGGSSSVSFAQQQEAYLSLMKKTKGDTSSLPFAACPSAAEVRQSEVYGLQQMLAETALAVSQALPKGRTFTAQDLCSHVKKDPFFQDIAFAQE